MTRSSKDQGHWGGLKVEPKKFFGFVYLITHKETGRKYVGKKQLWVADGKHRFRPTHIQSDKWKWGHWKESNWKTYTGSSTELNKDIRSFGKDAFIFEILGLYSSKGDLHYAEVEEQVFRDVLRASLPDGKREYYNKSIANIRFIPPGTHSVTKKTRRRSRATCH